MKRRQIASTIILSVFFAFLIASTSAAQDKERSGEEAKKKKLQEIEARMRVLERERAENLRNAEEKIGALEREAAALRGREPQRAGSEQKLNMILERLEHIERKLSDGERRGPPQPPGFGGGGPQGGFGFGGGGRGGRQATIELRSEEIFNKLSNGKELFERSDNPRMFDAFAQRFGIKDDKMTLAQFKEGMQGERTQVAGGPTPPSPQGVPLAGIERKLDAIIEKLTHLENRVNMLEKAKATPDTKKKDKK